MIASLIAAGLLASSPWPVGARSAHAHATAPFSAIGESWVRCAGPTTRQGQRLTVEGGELVYDVAGDGAPIVFIHGGLVDRRLWDREFFEFCKDHRVIRYDVRPLGESTLGSSEVSHVDDLLRLLDALAIERATIVGLSFGGMIALDFALEHPRRIDRLVLAGASVRGFPYAQDDRLRRIYGLARADTLTAVNLFVDSTSMISKHPDARGAFRRMLLDNAAEWTNPRYYVAAQWPEVPTIQRLSRIEAPTLVLVGEADYADLRATADTLAHAIPNARLVVVAGAAHHVNLDRPERFMDAVRSFLGGSAAGGRRPGEIDTLALKSHAYFLAHDLLEGRGTASRGEKLAALYLSARLRALGLAPLSSTEDHRLPVPLTAVSVNEQDAFVRVFAGDTRTVRAPDFYHPGGSRAAFRDFAGELLFAGAVPGALAALEDHADLSGRVVVLTSPWSGVEMLEAELIRRGAAGTVNLIPNGELYHRLRIVRGPTRYYLPDAVEDAANQSWLPRIVGGPELLHALRLEEEARPGRTLERARALGRIEVRLPHAIEPRTGYNVAGYISGTDPALRDEFIVYVAHYDHVGHGEASAGDSIWNGFIDNAAGSSMLLEIARVLASEPPARSVAFLWVTAEEQGLLGSNWFVHDPPLPLARIRAALNLDGGAPPAPPTTWGVVGADASWVGEAARRVVESHGWTVDARPIGPESDHWPFAKAKVPAVMLFPGQTLEGLSVQEAAALTQRWLHPHTPHDEWHPDFPFSGLERYAELALEIGRSLASGK